MTIAWIINANAIWVIYFSLYLILDSSKSNSRKKWKYLAKSVSFIFRTQRVQNVTLDRAKVYTKGEWRIQRQGPSIRRQINCYAWDSKTIDFQIVGILERTAEDRTRRNYMKRQEVHYKIRWKKLVPVCMMMSSKHSPLCNSNSMKKYNNIQLPRVYFLAPTFFSSLKFKKEIHMKRKKNY